jgi:predicted nucleic acid-binding protein
VLIWDASALAKRYAPERGSDTVQALFALVSPSDTTATVWGFAETFSILLRYRNRGTIGAASFARAVFALETEILQNPGVFLLPIEEADVLVGITLMQRHNINSADAAFLAAILGCRRLAPSPSTCVLVTADQRLLRAAAAEGLATLDPEQPPAADVPAFLAAL